MAQQGVGQRRLVTRSKKNGQFCGGIEYIKGIFQRGNGRGQPRFDFGHSVDVPGNPLRVACVGFVRCLRTVEQLQRKVIMGNPVAIIRLVAPQVGQRSLGICFRTDFLQSQSNRWLVVQRLARRQRQEVLDGHSAAVVNTAIRFDHQFLSAAITERRQDTRHGLSADQTLQRVAYPDGHEHALSRDNLCLNFRLVGRYGRQHSGDFHAAAVSANEGGRLHFSTCMFEHLDVAITLGNVFVLDHAKRCGLQFRIAVRVDDLSRDCFKRRHTVVIPADRVGRSQKTLRLAAETDRKCFGMGKT